MKKLYGWAFVILLLVFVSATSPNSTTPTPMHSLQGTWELKSFYNYDGQNISDTIPVSEGYRQVKMYSRDRVIWARIDPRAPIGRFGYGTYEITPTELIEHIEFGDAEFMKALDTMRVFRFRLELKDNSFSQITVDENDMPTFSENYERVE